MNVQQNGAQRPIFLAAGGTGGHLFPAMALAEVLRDRGHDIHLLTDERVGDYGTNFPASAIHLIPSASLSLSSPHLLPARLVKLATGYCKSRSLIKREAPGVVVGFGGYPSLPPVLAAVHLGIATVVHEQNSVLGRANRLLAPRVRAIATSFERVLGVPASAADKVTLTGNPVRQRVKDAATARYQPPPARGDLKILIFGGSQGARFFSEAVPDALAHCPEAMRKRLLVTQQCRSEDIARVRISYSQSGIRAELQAFFSDLPERMAASHLIVARSGASTIAELGVIGRPAVLVPLPGAIDNDQLNNAQSFAAAGAGFVLQQKDADPLSLSQLLQELLGHPQRLKEAAAAALRHGRADAAHNLAALVEHHMST